MLAGEPVYPRPVTGAVIREGTLDDLGAATALLNRAWPLRVGSERGYRHALTAEPPEAHRRFWAAEEGGALVGWATASIDYESSKRPGFVQVCVAAVVDGSPVAFSLLRVTEDGRAVNDMTGTLHAHRGRGLALLVKRATLVNAAARGVQFVTTDNDETNAPMLRVNEKLGYRPAGSRLSWSRP